MGLATAAVGNGRRDVDATLIMGVPGITTDDELADEEIPEETKVGNMSGSAVCRIEEIRSGHRIKPTVLAEQGALTFEKTDCVVGIVTCLFEVFICTFVVVSTGFSVNACLSVVVTVS